MSQVETSGYFWEGKLVRLRPMKRHAKWLGCQEEGRIRRNIYTNGRYYDELVFGLTKEEFEKGET